MRTSFSGGGGEGRVRWATLSGRFRCLLRFWSLGSILAVSSWETAAADCVHFFRFILSVDETWGFVDGVDVGSAGSVNRLAVSVKILIGNFDSLRAAKVFYLVVDGATDIGRKLP